MHEYFPAYIRENLFLCLGRGTYNYTFDKEGKMILANNRIPSKEQKLRIDRVSYELHERLYELYDYVTDVVFSRDSYCKIDLLPSYDRGEQLFRSGAEDTMAHDALIQKGLDDGIFGLIEMARFVGEIHKVELKITTDGKYLEVGISTKLDNVNYYIENLMPTFGHQASDYAFFGDEFSYLIGDIKGSDAYMITLLSRDSDFFDVAVESRKVPSEVTYLGGGIDTFKIFLKEQIILKS